jgi:HEPN domain-containing protein
MKELLLMNAPNPEKQLALVKEWEAKANEDFEAVMALSSLNQTGCFNTVICFHAQQCIEKLLKGCLVKHYLNPPKIHDLLKLYDDIMTHEPLPLPTGFTEDELEDALQFLTQAAVALRYPGKGMEKTQAQQAEDYLKPLSSWLLGVLAS